MSRHLSELKHVHRPLRKGRGEVVVLNTGALIDPEAEAMLQALHSRSLGGIRDHLRVLVERGPEKFMSTYYVGYGHKSIGDCGTVTVFVEGVSMLAAKAIQDWRLYSGQEASTRYIDFSKQEFVDPVGTRESKGLLEKQRSFYLLTLSELVPHLVKQFPKQKHEKEAVYKKAISARAFDIARSLLPAGASTNLAWHMNLRQFADELSLLRHHPLEEVREIALTTEDALVEAFPNSFTLKRYTETEEYNDLVMMWINPQLGRYDLTDLYIAHDGVDRDLLRSYKVYLEKRPPKTELPRRIAECGTIRFAFPLDFGSFRDVQRQRAVIQRMPMVTDHHGFETWYAEQLPQKLRNKLSKHLDSVRDILDHKMATFRHTRQYYIPMGYRLPNELTGDLHALTYLVELRASSTVHPTLQNVSYKIADELRDRFGKYGLTVHTSGEPGRFDTKRGEQDIVKRENV